MTHSRYAKSRSQRISAFTEVKRATQSFERVLGVEGREVIANSVTTGALFRYCARNEHCRVIAERRVSIRHRVISLLECADESPHRRRRVFGVEGRSYVRAFRGGGVCDDSLPAVAADENS